MFSEFFNFLSLWLGDGCVKDTHHCVVHPQRHHLRCTTVNADKQLTATERAIWAQRGTVLGWSDPTFGSGFVANVSRRVAPAQLTGLSEARLHTFTT